MGVKYRVVLDRSEVLVISAINVEHFTVDYQPLFERSFGDQDYGFFLCGIDTLLDCGEGMMTCAICIRVARIVDADENDIL